MKKAPEVFLGHILYAIQDIETHIRGIELDSFLDDVTRQDAVIRKLEIIGEAVKNLSVSFKALHADVPWREIAGLRDKLVHDYFGVDLFAVWNMAVQDIPALKLKIEKIMKRI